MACESGAHVLEQVMPLVFQSPTPGQFTAGDTVRFVLSELGYSPPTHSAILVLRKSDQLITKATTGSAGEFTGTLEDTETSLLPPGTYAVGAIFTETATGAKRSLLLQPIVVKPSLTNTDKGPRRAAYEQAQAALDKLVKNQFSTASFNGQTFSKMNAGELQGIVDRLRIDALHEDRELGIGTAGGLVRIVTRM